MPSEPPPTLREYQESRALQSYMESLRDFPSVPIELVPGHEPHPDVARYWAVMIDKHTYRVAILYSYPGRGGNLNVGADGDRPSVVRFLATHGVPAVRLGKVTRSPVR